MRSKLIASLVLLGLCLGIITEARAEVFLAQDEALAQAFPGAASVQRKTFVLDKQQHHRAELLAKAKIDSSLVTFYIGRENSGISGFAIIDTHTVRTHTETIMVVLTPAGEVRKTVVLAFHEPSEYLASERWLKQFEGSRSPAAGQIGQDIAGIVGSTLTSQAIAAGVRRALALYAVLGIGDLR